MSSPAVHFDSIEDPLERLEAIGRMATPSPPVFAAGSAEGFTIQSNLDGIVDEEEEGVADQALALELFDLINHEDIWKVSTLQAQVLEETRMAAWTLGDFCASSGKVLADLSKEYESHAKIILEMKKDLDSIFKKARAVKAMLYAKYPAAKVAAMAELEEDS